MKKTLLLSIATIGLFACSVAQSASGKTVDNTFSTDLYFGATSSFAFGKYTQYQRSFSQVTSENTQVSGKILPLSFFGIGVSERYTPFKDKVLSNFSVSLGMEYLQRGFTSTYKSVYSDPANDITDKSTFRETYHINVLSIPLVFRWGKKWYGEVGLGANAFIGGRRTHLLQHTVTGGDAYNGGFDEKDRYSAPLAKSMMKFTTVNAIVGGGVNFSKVTGLRLEMLYTRNAFKTGLNFQNITLQLQFCLNISQLMRHKDTAKK